MVVLKIYIFQSYLTFLINNNFYSSKSIQFSAFNLRVPFKFGQQALVDCCTGEENPFIQINSLTMSSKQIIGFPFLIKIKTNHI